MQTVYRVEDASGGGPYWCGSARGMDLYCTTRHPPPCEDGLLEIRVTEIFGFASREDLLRWFGPEARASLRTEGYQLAMYEAHEVRRGRRQVVFNRETATRCSVEPLP